MKQMCGCFRDITKSSTSAKLEAALPLAECIVAVMESADAAKQVA